MKNEIGSKIAELRKACGMTQEQLATSLGITYQSVSKWETGMSCPDVAILPDIADIFDVSIDELFGRSARAAEIRTEGLPWEDDGNLRAVLFEGRKYIDSESIHSVKHLFKGYQTSAAQVELHFSGSVGNIESAYKVVCENSEIKGNVKAGDSVICGDVGGSVDAGDGIKCGNISGSAKAGDGISCGNIGGNVSAGDSVRCGSIGGNVSAGDSVHCASCKKAHER